MACPIASMVRMRIICCVVHRGQVQCRHYYHSRPHRECGKYRGDHHKPIGQHFHHRRRWSSQVNLSDIIVKLKSHCPPNAVLPTASFYLSRRLSYTQNTAQRLDRTCRSAARSPLHRRICQQIPYRALPLPRQLPARRCEQQLLQRWRVAGRCARLPSILRSARNQYVRTASATMPPRRSIGALFGPC